jgi:hypothetical protein
VQILINDRLRYRAVPLSELVPYLEWLINNLVVQANRSGDRYCLIHAAVVARGTQGVLICGKAGCGKSSLSLALMRRRYRYLSDEIACWDTALRRMIAYPKAITLKESGYTRFLKERIRLPTRMWRTRSFEDRLWYINPEDMSPRLIGKSAKIRLLIFPTYHPTEQIRLHRVPGGRAIMLLHRQRFDGNGFGQKDFEALTDLVEGVSAFRLIYGDVFEAAALIEKLTRQQTRT